VTTYRICDLFCGAGGSSTGAIRAIEAMGGEVDLCAVNHWDVAIATHSRNHRHARHFCVNLDAARPEDLVPDGSLDLLMASPECTFFSRARGGKPVNDQSRMSAWHVQHWATTLDIRCILVENVAEFVTWGPLTADGKTDKARKGLYFQAWIKALAELGYDVDWRMLNAADYGDATTRTRFFLQARKDGAPIRWPEPSHSPSGSSDLFGERPRWRAAREIIDWSNLGRSLLDRKRPLSLKTRLRIARGLAKFGGPLAPLYIRLLDLPPEDGESSSGDPQPFIFVNREHNVPRPVTEPIPTMTTAPGGGVVMVGPTAEPFIQVARENNLPRGVDEPLQTITTVPAMYLVEPVAEPFVLGQQSGSAPRSTDEPIPTIATGGAIALINPMIAPYYGTSSPTSVEKPLPTVTTKDRFGLCEPVCLPCPEPFVLSRFSSSEGGTPARSVDQPVPTVVGRGAGYLVQPFIVPNFSEAPGQAPRVHALEDPLPAVTSHGAGALVEPILLQTDQTGSNGLCARSVEDPLPTVVTKQTMAVVEPFAEPAVGDVPPEQLVLINGAPYRLDIRFRMLSNRELARAMGFDDVEQVYEFTGTAGEVTKQIGNAVACHTAEALVTSILGDR